ADPTVTGRSAVFGAHDEIHRRTPRSRARAFPPTRIQETSMATTYRYAWLAVLDGKGRKNLNDQLLEIEGVNPALTQQNAPGAVWIINWDNAPARLATTALSGNVGKDADIEVVMVSVQGD